MKDRFSMKLMLTAAFLLAGTAMASTNGPSGPQTDADIAQKVIHEIRMYPRYTLFDNISVRVHDGEVELEGQVSQPFKKADVGRLAQHVAGVRSVTNELEIL